MDPAIVTEQAEAERRTRVFDRFRSFLIRHLPVSEHEVEDVMRHLETAIEERVNEAVAKLRQELLDELTRPAATPAPAVPTGTPASPVQPSASE